MKQEVEIREVENGWVVEDTYFGDETYCETFVAAKDMAIERFTRFQKENNIKK